MRRWKHLVAFFSRVCNLALTALQAPVLRALVAAVGLTLACSPAIGCAAYGQTDDGYGGVESPDDTSGDPLDDYHPTQKACNCVFEPPATYSGPSLFWIGPPPQVQACPPDTPNQGIQGFVDSPQVPRFARECLVTPTGACTSQGTTCVPFPSEGFRVCIHHDNDDACPKEHYTDRTTMIDEDRSLPVTLCCTAPNRVH